MKVIRNASYQINTVKLKGVPVTLYQRGDVKSNNWHMAITITGERLPKRETTKTDIFDDAEVIARKRQMELEVLKEHGFPVRNKSFKNLGNEVLAKIKKRVERGDLSAENLRVQTIRMNKFLIPYFGSKDISKVTQKTVDSYWDWRIDYWSNHTDDPRYKYIPKNRLIPNYRTLVADGVLLNTVFNNAIEQELMKSERKPDTAAPGKSDKGKRCALNEKEVAKLESYLLKWRDADKRTNVIYSRYRTHIAINVCLLSGMRPPECYNLKWKDIIVRKSEDIEWVQLNVHGKSKAHTIDCSIMVKNFLDIWKKRSLHTDDDDFVFALENGERPNSFNTMFVEALKNAGIPTVVQGQDRTFYSLRHTYATVCLENEIDPLFLVENMSTGIQNIIDHYGHVKGSKKAIASIPKEMRKNKGVSLAFDELFTIKPTDN